MGLKRFTIQKNMENLLTRWKRGCIITPIENTIQICMVNKIGMIAP